MELYFLRHGIAVLRGTKGYENDSDRPLTPKGRKRMRQIAAAMRVLEIEIDLILSSPILRARQTTDIVSKSVGREVKFSEAVADGDPERIIDEINTTYHRAKSIMIVGHEPDLSSMISLLISGGTGCHVTMKKGGLCKLSISSLQAGQCAVLEWLLTPGQLAQIQ